MDNGSFEFKYELQRGDDLSVKAREFFIRSFRKAFFDFLDQHSISQYHPPSIMFYKMMGEMVRNVWDHTITGQGRVMLKFQSDASILDFEVRDYDTTPRNVGEIAKIGSSKNGNGINHGVGLILIQASVQPLDIQNFTVDTSCGFVYRGSIPLKIRMRTT